MVLSLPLKGRVKHSLVFTVAFIESSGLCTHEHNQMQRGSATPASQCIVP